MAHYTEPPKRRRVEVPFPSGKSARQKRAPSPNYQQRGGGTNRALIDAGIVVLTTLLTTVLLLTISSQIRDTTAAALIGESPAPLLRTTQPTPQPSLPAAALSPQLARSAATPSLENQAISPAATPDDSEVQEAIDNKLGDDASLSQLGITATVSDGKVILVGTAPSVEMKDKVEKLVRAVKGVKQIDNQIVVISQ